MENQLLPLLNLVGVKRTLLGQLARRKQLVMKVIQTPFKIANYKKRQEKKNKQRDPPINKTKECGSVLLMR